MSEQSDKTGQVLVLLGGGGDLALRMLLPSLYNLDADRLLPADLRIVGVARHPMEGDNDYLEVAREALDKRTKVDEQVWSRFSGRLSYLAADMTSAEGGAALSEAVGDHSALAIFFAVSPSLFAPICASLGAAGLTGPKTRLVLEKPIGRDQESSRAINNAVAAVVGEDQTFRIDHYLGKETVQNLAALRFANVLFEPLWTNQTIDNVQITVAESVGAGTRGYYDESGALRDMVQNHIIQLLCLVAMEPPASDDANALRDEKLKVLRSLKPITGGDVAKATVRGQYRAGSVDGAAVASYQDELPEDKKGSRTETFVALKAEIENWRWAGVPFYIRTGKRLPSRASEIVVQFRHIPDSMFDHAEGAPRANRLVIRIQPDEGVKLFLMIKDPGPGGMRLREVPLNLSFAEAFAERTPEAYERLLLDVVRGSQTLFMRRDELEAAWTWIDPIRDAWNAASDAPQAYMAGTWGPTAAIALIERDGRTWHEDEN